MDLLFSAKPRFNEEISGWNTEKVTEMDYMFSGASEFNQPIEGWNTEKVNSMYYMFEGASEFNQPIGEWNVGNVISMANMFEKALKFNQNLSKWNLRSVLTMYKMFEGARDFVQDMSSWNWKPSCSMNNGNSLGLRGEIRFNTSSIGNPVDMFKNSGIDGKPDKYPVFYKELEGSRSNSVVNLLNLKSKYCTSYIPPSQ